MATDALIRPETLVAALFTVASALVFWRLRERRLSAQRRVNHAINILAEEIIAASTAGAIMERLAAALPEILRVTGVRVFLYDRSANTLNLAGLRPGAARVSIPVESAGDVGPAMAFRNRALLAFTDLNRGEMQAAPGLDGPVRAAMFVPMIRKGEAAGVLEAVDAARAREFSPDERAAAQHLGNQVAAALGLLEEQSMREQVFRTEKLAASGELISGVANELRLPLESISDLASRVLDDAGALACERELRAIAREADRAVEIVERLVSFSRAETEALRPVDLVELLRKLIGYRARNWTARGINLRSQLPEKPAPVLGVEDQLEEVFQSLLVRAEESVAGQRDKTVSIVAEIVDGKILIEVSYPGVPAGELRDEFERGREAKTGALGLGVCRGILRGSGGDIRSVASGPVHRIEVTIPLTAPDNADDAAPVEIAPPAQALTLIVVEPDDVAARRILMLLADRGHRAVLTPGGEEAISLAERFRFDALFSALRLPGISWAELFDRTRGRVLASVLLTESYDAGFVVENGDKNYFVLSKPIYPPKLEQVLAAIAARTVVE